MSNSISVVPYSDSLTITKVDFYLQYQFNGNSADVLCYLKNISGDIVKTQTIHIPIDVYASWTADGPIITYILTQLSLVALI